MGRKVGATAVILAVISACLVATAGVAMASSSSDLISKINAERSGRGIATLASSSSLAASALEQSKAMAAKGSIFHNPNLGDDVANWVAIGENVGMGMTVSGIHDAFMASAGHRANILSNEFRAVGVGIVEAGDKIYVTEVFARFASVTTTVTTTKTTTTKNTTTVRPSAPRTRSVRAASTEQVSRPKARAASSDGPVREAVRTVAVLQMLAAR